MGVSKREEMIFFCEAWWTLNISNYDKKIHFIQPDVVKYRYF